MVRPDLETMMDATGYDPAHLLGLQPEDLIKEKDFIEKNYLELMTMGPKGEEERAVQRSAASQEMLPTQLFGPQRSHSVACLKLCRKHSAGA